MTNQLRHRSGGPRPDVTSPPLDLSGLGSTRATRAARFIEGLTVPSGKGAAPFEVRRDDEDGA
jgi:hypothetical protein